MNCHRLRNLAGIRFGRDHDGCYSPVRYAVQCLTVTSTQRPLWASTGVKNQDYPDTLYVSGLIAPDTVEQHSGGGCVSGTVTGSGDLHQLIQPGGSVMPAGSFTADITAIRKRARQKMEDAGDLVDLLGA